MSGWELHTIALNETCLEHSYASTGCPQLMMLPNHSARGNAAMYSSVDPNVVMRSVLRVQHWVLILTHW